MKCQTYTRNSIAMENENGFVSSQDSKSPVFVFPKDPLDSFVL